MHATTDSLAGFLRSRREALAPEHVGLATGDRRRVPGLRREELAQLAGVSVSYYVRLEQGVCTTASESVLDAIAGALALDGDGCDHLRRLGRPPRKTAADPDVLPERVAALMAAMTDVPAVAIGPRMDVLGWNALGHRLLAGHLSEHAPSDPATRPNMARMAFTDPHTHELFVDLDDKRREAVAYLRASAGRYPGDGRLHALVGELSVGSEAFAALWAQAPVAEKTEGIRRFAHPVVGRLDLAFQALATPGTPGCLLISFLAAPGSPEAASLRLLAA